MQSFKIIFETPELKTLEPIYVDNLAIVKSLFKPGYTFVTEYFDTVVCSELTSKHVVVRGAFTESTGTLPDRAAGFTTTECEELIPAGVYTRGVSDIGCEMWCIRSTDPKVPNVDHVNILRLAAQDTVDLPVGTGFIVAEGTCSINSATLQDEKPYKISTAIKTLQANTDSFVFTWTTAI